ncbi:hypothetical protein [Lederbergia citrea]|uniref:Lipoprotein n=1 Tax=Lederbergia citrea TaxID=2833581 RepID=A0A942UJW5_9BACI|nr:hypothetical protein [Lederbergia citrea]MBS4175982.1 hypothetical protein [Lederbergia citrea]MBS4202543.1 hypothetical protein [Lederbergia citrea]MBS4222790.1 hypothetical protein [Lederbergia citrea]
MKKIVASFIIIFTAMIIAACGTSIDKEKINAEANAKKVFQEKSKGVNEEIQSIQFHLPSGVSIKDKSPNNIILEKGKQPYILFYNPIENKQSEELYEMSKTNSDKMVVDQIFKADNRFGYLLIKDAGDNIYEVTAGVGGVKATTNSTVGSIAKDAELLMTMAASTVVKE